MVKIFFYLFGILCIFMPLMGRNVMSLVGRNVLLEFKTGYFVPTNGSFRHIYHQGGALYGPELSVQLTPERNWYGFISADYLKAHGHSIDLDNPTSVRLFPVALGFKYFSPIRDGNIDVYAGLGFQAAKVRTADFYDNTKVKISKWGYGAITKVGAYCHLPYNFFLDLFIDYTYLSVGKNSNNLKSTMYGYLQSVEAHIGGLIFGAGIGYTF